MAWARICKLLIVAGTLIKQGAGSGCGSMVEGEELGLNPKAYPKTSMKLKAVSSCLFTCVLAIGLLNAPLLAKDKESKLGAKAKISKKVAKKIALAKVPQGKIKEAELEEENGKLVWSFDIATPHSKDITEVQVNAVTGEIVSVDKETPADQKKEKKKEAK